jgi:Pectate lyase superfamily protein
MSASQTGTFNVQEFSDLGSPLVGGRLYTYAFGTTTQKTAYTDAAGTISQTYTSDGLGGQYIALNARGELPAPLYLAAGSYDLALKTAQGATVWTRRADPVGQLAVDLSASNGASLVGFIQSGTGAVTTTVQTKLRESVSVKDFGAVGDGVTDDTAAIQAAISSGAAHIHFPQGIYSINSCINLTLRGALSPIKITGVGAPYGGSTPSTGGTTILGNTGTWMFDCTGSSFITFEDILLYGNTSKGGILHARAAAGSNYALYTRYVKVYIYIKTNPAFTSAGSIALFCDCTENQVVEQCWFEADTPYVTTLNNEVGVSSVYSTIVSSPASNTDVSHRQNVYKGITGASMIAYGLGSSTFDQCFWQKAVVGNTYNHAIVLNSSVNGYLTNQKINFTGQIEDYNYGFLLGGDTTNLNINLTTAAVNTALVRVTGATNHYGLGVNIQTYSRAANKRVIDSTNTSVVNLYGGNIYVSDGGKLDSTYIKYIGTNIQMDAIDTHDNAQFNYANGSTYTLSSLTTPLFSQVAVTAGSILSGRVFAGGVSCPGARLGDFVKVSASVDMQACSLTGYVQTNDSVVIVINNNTSGTVSFGSALYKVVVSQS